MKNKAIFAVRHKLHFNDALIKNKAGKKELGRRSGESPSAHLLHRSSLCRSDLPLLFIYNLFIMRHNEKCQAPTQNEQPFNVVNHHTQNFYKTIKDFYRFAHPSDFIEANNDLLNTYLEKGLREEEGYCHRRIQNIVFMITLQNQFLTALKEDWEAFKKFANPKIEEQ